MRYFKQVMFRQPKKRCLKSTRFVHDSDSGDESSICIENKLSKVNESAEKNTGNIVEIVKNWQKLRKRQSGLSAESLISGKRVDNFISTENDPFKMKTGGLIDVKGIYRAAAADEFEDEVRLSKTFAAETNKRDEDADMLKYIEEELAKRKGIVKDDLIKKKTVPDDLFSAIPGHLRPSIGQQKEDMISNQMLCGIPEVDLGVESKMRNIEATEEAKQSLVRDRYSRHRKQTTDGLAPANISVNFVQHSRWNGQLDPSIRLEFEGHQGDIPIPSANGLAKPNSPSANDLRVLEAERQRLQSEKSTDAFALQRFRNHMRNRRHK